MPRRRTAAPTAALLCLALVCPVHAGATTGAGAGAQTGIDAGTRAMPPEAGAEPSPSNAGADARAATPVWPDDRFHRVAALALLEQLRAALLSENSATLTLERWCRVHRIAADPRILALPDPAHASPPDADQRALLGIDAAEPVRYRHVRLLCGDTVLSEADNWYVPSRLTPDMNRVLDSTHTPFGKAIAALDFTRATLSSRLLWSPLPADWTEAPAKATGPARTLAMPDTLIENRALLRDRNGRPLALLTERYRAGILAFPPPTP